MLDPAIDRYLASLDELPRESLSDLRRVIHEVAPEAVECISYTLPGFRLRDTMIAGFGAYRDHLSYFPHSGSVLEVLRDELTGFTTTKGSLHFPHNSRLPKDLVAKLVATRLHQAFDLQ